MRKSDERLAKITLRVFAADIPELQRFYPKAGLSLAVRSIVRRHLRQRQEAENRVVSSLPEIEDNITL
jgi:hypothetical protein